MGCDIHLHVEIKIGNKWCHYALLDVDRSYSLFAKMAGVKNRDGIIPIDKPRGLPNNISQETLLHYEFWGTDAHSESYLTSQEIAELESWIKEQDWIPNNCFGRLFGNSFTSVYNGHAVGRSPTFEDFRFVFWFDN